MAESHFERLIAAERDKTLKAMLGIQLGDSHGHARLKGMCEAFDIAIAKFREAARADSEDVG